MRPKSSFRVSPPNIDRIIQEEFDVLVARAFERWKSSKWANSVYAGTTALMAFLSDEIPEKFEWEPISISSSNVPLIVLTGYTPELEEILGLQGELSKGLN